MTGTESSTARPVLAVFASLTAVSAYAGAVALATGMIDLGARAEAPFPFASPVFAAVALVLAGTVPMLVVANRAATGAADTAGAAVVAGALLIGWAAATRTLSWPHPVLAGAGLAVLLTGLRRPTPSGGRHGPLSR